MSTVLGCLRHPLKSAAREAVSRLRVGRDAVVGDRCRAVAVGDEVVSG